MSEIYATNVHSYTCRTASDLVLNLNFSTIGIQLNQNLSKRLLGLIYRFTDLLTSLVHVFQKVCLSMLLIVTQINQKL